MPDHCPHSAARWCCSSFLLELVCQYVNINISSASSLQGDICICCCSPAAVMIVDPEPPLTRVSHVAWRGDTWPREQRPAETRFKYTHITTTTAVIEECIVGEYFQCYSRYYLFVIIIIVTLFYSVLRSGNVRLLLFEIQFPP